MAKATHCQDCNIKLRSKHHSALLAPGTRERIGDRCSRCHINTKKQQPPTEFHILECEKCKRPTRDSRDKANAGILVRAGKLCLSCARHRDIPDADVRHMRADLDSWLESRRKRLGVAA